MISIFCKKAFVRDRWAFDNFPKRNGTYLRHAVKKRLENLLYLFNNLLYKNSDSLRRLARPWVDDLKIFDDIKKYYVKLIL